MDNFIVSARKYRPDTFRSVVGQQSITATLANAIKNGKLSHAYLFCGPRGIGKTTCARIFAKTINCMQLSENAEACNECESCRSFDSSRSFNIHELDAASNNSVEDIRILTEQVRVPPQVGKYSVYIIDEVHMLSGHAFNAFLKTLEEPPAHAVFILATTEKQKIIPTVLSRCQIFDFSRIKVDDIVAQLQDIAKMENVSAEADGLNIIANKADGSMRDALSIFDQIVSFSEGTITYRNVIENLNVLDYEYYFDMTSALLEGNMVKSFLLFNEILEKGFDGHNFISGLSSHFRDLLVCKDPGTLDLLEVGAGIRDNYKKQSQECPEEFLFRGIEITNQCSMGFRSARNQRLHVELALIQLSNITSEEKKKDETANLSSDKKTQNNNSSTRQDKGNSDPQANQTPQNVSPSQAAHPPRKHEAPVKTELSTISIKEVMHNSKSITVNQDETDNAQETSEDAVQPGCAAEASNDFSHEELVSAWKKFASGIKEEYPRLYNTLNANNPFLKKTGYIEFEISNPLQAEILNNIKGRLLDFLKKELGNYQINLTYSISESEEENKLYLPEDKYKHMAGKNPNLEKLKQQLNLDFE